MDMMEIELATLRNLLDSEKQVSKLLGEACNEHAERNKQLQSENIALKKRVEEAETMFKRYEWICHNIGEKIEEAMRIRGTSFSTIDGFINFKESVSALSAIATEAQPTKDAVKGEDLC
jgi:hypothetical protein